MNKFFVITLLIFLLSGCSIFFPVEKPQAFDIDEAYKKGNYAQVIKLLLPLATQGDASAQFSLALMYSESQGVTQNDKEAVKWYRLDLMYGEEGQGVTKNDKEAVKWYRLAAEQGHASAQSNLGVMYKNGQGVIQDYQEAVKWYRLAAEQGYANAQSNLGVMYHIGKGVIQDHVRAYMWYNLAASNGNKNGSENREIVAKLMTPAQISEAQDMSKNCKKKNYKNCN
jgi:TPR repeat protein